MRARLLLTVAVVKAQFPTPAPGVPPAQVLNVTYLEGPVCNDGTQQAVYYRPCSANWDRKNPNDDFCANITQRWIVVFESGAGYCYSPNSCASRDQNATSSSVMKAQAFLGGMLEPFAEANPNLYKASAVFVPSCTSDLFSGDSEAGAGTPFQFRGRAVVDAVLQRFLSDPAIDAPARLVDADEVLIVGPAGVMARIESLAQTIQEAASQASPPGNPSLRVFGMLDGGMLPGTLQPFNVSAADCTTDANCPPALALRAAAPLWWGPNATASEWMPWCPFAADPEQAYKCLLAETLLPYLANASVTTPVLVQQQQFDGSLLRAFGAWPGAQRNGTAEAAWATTVLATALLELLQTAPASFSAACEWPSSMAISEAFYRTLVRYEDAYNHTFVHPLLNAMGAFLDDPLSRYGVYRDNCTAAGVNCNPSGCAA